MSILNFVKINIALKNLIKRALTGILYVAVVVASIFVHPLLFAGVFSIITGFLIHELYKMSKYEGAAWQRYVGIFAGIYFFTASCLFAGCYVGSEIYIPYIIIILVLIISGLYTKQFNPANQWGILLLGQCYCAGLLSFLCFIPYMTSTGYDPMPLLLIFIFIWLNDTGAFLVGSVIGKHPLFQRISPRKTWEGFIGGLSFVVIASLAISCFYTDIPWYHQIAFAMTTVVFATWGDLLESLLKRTYGVKDSGKVLPGHGGVFDRFDSVILVSPAVFILFKLISVL